MRDPTRPNRKSLVVAIRAYPAGSFHQGGFKDLAEKKGIAGKDFWIVSIATKAGTRQQIIQFDVFENETEARDFELMHPVGSIWSEHEHVSNDSEAARELGNMAFDDPGFGGLLFAAGGSDDGFLAWDTKEKAGFHDRGIGVSKKISDFLGAERINELRDAYGDNWTAVAHLEYCWYNLPASSAAYIAALQEYHEYITGDDFSAGYLLRDLEILVFGVEVAANRAAEFSERQAKRAAQGGKAHAEKAAQRKRVIFRLALESSSQWVWRSEREQVRHLRKLAEDHDRENGEKLFQHSNKLLSFSWFQDVLADLRNSGELQRMLEGKKP